jgi:hypothetical protein
MIVGVLGFIGSGKGTVGDILKETVFQHLSFASPLKDVTADMFGWPRELLEGDTEESRIFREKRDEYWSQEFKKDFTPRLALQLMGTEVGRNVFHEDFWVIKAKLEMHKQMSCGVENFVITDVRFPNEMKMLQKEGGILIEVQRGVKPHWYDIANKANRGDTHALSWMQNMSGVHISEWGWVGSEIDYVIENNGTKEQLKKKVVSCLTNSFGANIMNESIEGVL